MLATSPGVRPTSWPCGTAPASVRPTTGSAPNWPTCASRSGGPPTKTTSTRRRNRQEAGLFGVLVENFEPITWAEELIEPARTVDHPSFVQCVRSPHCAGCSAATTTLSRTAMRDRRHRRSPDEVPFGFEIWLGSVYSTSAISERWVEFCRDHLARGHDTDELTRACLVMR